MMLNGLEEFRQHLGGRLTLTMPDGIGKKREIHQLDGAIVAEAVAWLAETKTMAARK